LSHIKRPAFPFGFESSNFVFNAIDPFEPSVHKSRHHVRAKAKHIAGIIQIFGI